MPIKETVRLKEEKFFNCCSLNKDTVRRYVTEACNPFSVTREGLRDHMTAHSLRATCITNVFESGHQEEVISTKPFIEIPNSHIHICTRMGNLVNNCSPICVVEIVQLRTLI